jgi:hypothetical protein
MVRRDPRIPSMKRCNDFLNLSRDSGNAGVILNDG